MSASTRYDFTKKVLACKGKPEQLAEGDEITYEITLSNLGDLAVGGTITDSIPPWVGTVEWADSTDGSGDTNDISVDVAVNPGETYTMYVTVTVGPVDSCKTKTFHNVATYTPAGECTTPVNACADVCVIGCTELRFDPRVQRMDDRRALAIMLDFDEAGWKQVIDRVNCGEPIIPTPAPPEIDLEAVCDLLIEKMDPEGPGDLKALVQACVEALVNKQYIVDTMAEGI